MTKEKALEIVCLEELQAVLKDINKLGVYEPAFNEKETDIETIISELQEIVLNIDDSVTEATKRTLNTLGFGPWQEVPATENKEIPLENSESSKKEDKPMENKKESAPQKEKKQVEKLIKTVKVKKAPSEKSRYGHRVGSFAAAMDELLWKGITIAEGAKVLSETFKKSPALIEGSLKIHIRYLENKKNIPVNLKGDVYKASKATIDNK